MALDPITAIGNLINTGLAKFIPDANLREQASMELAGNINMQVLGQLEINKEEAKSESIFVAGWRPFIGWVCGGAYAYTFIVQPFLVFVILACGVQFDQNQLPHLNWSELGFVLAGILGLGAMRTHEKRMGAA